MPERAFASETWDSDEWFQELSRDQRYLFIYLWTNNHCNQAGLYHITLTTIANEACFSREELPDLLRSLEAKVAWYPEENLIWVKNFIKRQSKSPKFLAAAGRCLTTIRNNGAVHELLEYYKSRYSISIPYQYYMDRLSILTRVTDTDTDTKADTKRGGGNQKKDTPLPNGKGARKKQASTQTDSRVKEIFNEIHSFFGYPDKVNKDPIPNYAKEGQFIKKMLTRGFTCVEIVACWRGKVSQRGGDFVSMQWVNEDIGKKGGASGADKRYSGAGQKRRTAEDARSSLRSSKRDG